MDFLKDVKAKLQEFEELSRQAQQQQPGRQSQKQKGSAIARAQQAKRKSQPQPQQQTRRSRRPVDSDVCPVEEALHHQNAARPPGDSSIFDSLAERLDEAFLLQEVLGPPRCMRELE